MHLRSSIVAAVTVALFSGAADAQVVGIGTGPQGALTNRIGSAVAKVIADGAGLKTRAVPHTSNAHHVPLVEKGTLTFGVNSTGNINNAIAGKSAFEGHPTKNWVVVARLVPLPVGTIVRASSPYHTLRDLKGEKFPVGFTAHKTVLEILNAYLANAGMSADDFEGVPVPNTSAGTELFLKGTVAGTPSSLGGARLRNADAKADGIRILKMFNTPEAVAAMQKEYPNSYLVELKPGKVVGVEEPTWTMAFDMFLMASGDAPDDVVYKSVQALHRGKEGLVKVSGVFNGFEPDNMSPRLEGVRYHSAAVKFYREIGTWKSGT